MSITDIEIVHCKVRPKFKDLESVVCNFLINVVNVIGKIEGLKSGSTHAIHILEYSDISETQKNISKDYFT